MQPYSFQGSVSCGKSFFGGVFEVESSVRISCSADVVFISDEGFQDVNIVCHAFSPKKKPDNLSGLSLAPRHGRKL